MAAVCGIRGDVQTDRQTEEGPPEERDALSVSPRSRLSPCVAPQPPLRLIAQPLHPLTKLLCPSTRTHPHLTHRCLDARCHPHALTPLAPSCSDPRSEGAPCRRRLPISLSLLLIVQSWYQLFTLTGLTRGAFWLVDSAGACVRSSCRAACSLPPRLLARPMNLLKCWYNRLLFSRFEYKASLWGPRREAVAVSPPWGIVLLRPGPPGPMPTFYTRLLGPLRPPHLENPPHIGQYITEWF